MAKQFSIYNGASSVTGPTPVTTGAALKTMIQVATSASKEMAVTEWWWGGDAFAAAAPGVVELVYQASLTTPATVTAYAAADIKKYDVNSVASLITLGATASGFTASAEGTSVNPFNVPQQVSPTSGFYIQYPYGARPEVAASNLLRLRNKFAGAVNAVCGIAWEE